jgi:GAF domain-containing protein
MEIQARLARLAVGFEVVGWIIAAGLAALASGLSPALLPGQRAWLFGLSGLAAAATLVFFRLMPASSARGVRYAPEDKALIAGLCYLLVLTAFFYSLYDLPAGIVFLYLLPIFAGALGLHEKVVLGQALMALVAAVFLRASVWQAGPFFKTGFVIELAVFLVVSGAAVALTRALRLSFERAVGLGNELSRRLDQIQVISTVVRQSEFFPQFETLLGRLGEIVSDAFNAEQEGIFLHDPAKDALVLRKESVGLRDQTREFLALAAGERLFRETFLRGEARLCPADDGALAGLTGSAGIRGMMLVPLRVRDRSLGLLALANRRDRPFTKEDLDFCQLLAGFVAALIDSSSSLQKVQEERRNVERMMRLLVGRELRMRELKERLRDVGPL